MKNLGRYLTLTAFAAMLAISQTAFAGDCCKKTATAAKAGKACEKCVTDQCCKDAAKAALKTAEGKTCATCAAKKKQ